jgi:hypothetical protein
MEINVIKENLKLKANDMYKANFKPSSKARLAPCLNDVIAT